ncbi:SANT domain-containing protein [Heracleum sosnowskyi]|uniref:SANT domain-containing protein n=1 Tax=Heracleum sosnowskyi TaxID=360622 RepID=A0AAD8MXS7_9APIA|nr:SANT domain-containing protein [Heracleum sosnowskyi]
MVSGELNQNGKNIEDSPAKKLFSIDGVCGEPELLPRVGDGFQAEIPALIKGAEYDIYLKTPFDAENKDHVPYDFWLGLAVPVTWIRIMNEVDENKKDEKLDVSIPSTDSPLMFGSVKKKSDLCYALVPGICSDSWNDLEEASFLLGLYLLMKKFVPLTKFIASKKMGETLFFYYTKFYRSTEFSRWSARTKGRKGKCEDGKWLLSGLRRKELLSRLLPQVSEECQRTLREVTKTFAKKDMSLITYVFLLKSSVGLKTFVDAVAIGKGDEDLTSMVIRPVQIPVGEACSGLTHAEIVKFLTGGYSLTNDQCSDLFWGAVWPRLLARGWQSELPKNRAYCKSQMDSLVFLSPGVEKFSRKLVKGDHYFVSLTDVLSKVSSKPELLELQTDYDEGEKKEDKGLIVETTEQEKLPKKRRCYLQPQTPITDMDVMTFTVVDTSLGNGIFLKFEESKTFPVDMSNKKIVSRDSDMDTSEPSDCSQKMLADQEKSSTTHAKFLPGTGKLYDGSADQLVQIEGPDSMKPVERTKEQKNMYDNEQARKAVDIQLSQKLKGNNVDTSLSVTKRRRTTTAAAYSNEELGSGRSTFPLGPKFGDLVLGSGSSSSDVHDPNSIACSQVGSSKIRLAFTSSPKGSPSWSTRGSNDQENSQSHMFVDLKYPQQAVDFPGDVLLTDSTNMQDGITTTQPDNSCALKTSAYISIPEQPSDMNSRRKGTRNRPPTARALEALVNGDLTAKTRQKKHTYAR